MFNQNFKKRTLESLHNLPFKIEIQNLQKYTTQNLKEYIYKFYHHSKTLNFQITEKKTKIKKLEAQITALKDSKLEISTKNLEINTLLEKNLIKLDFSELFEKSLIKVFEKIGISDPRFISGCDQIKVILANFEKKIDNVEKFVIDLEKAKIQNEDKIDFILLGKYNDKIKEFIGFMNVEVENQKNDVMNGFKYLFQNYQNFVKSVQYLFYNITQQKSDLIENYKFEDLILITMRKFNGLIDKTSKMKNENLLKSSEIKILEKKIKNLIKNNDLIENEKIELEKEIFEFERKYEDLLKKRNISENEKTGHLEILKLLQNENYKLNLSLKSEKDERQKEFEINKNLEEENKTQKKKLKEIDTKYLSQLRQAQLKLNQSLQDKNNLEEKIIDLNIMLQQENAKYENLYKKFHDFKKDNQKKGESFNILKKLTNSFENTVSRTPRDKSPFSLSGNSGNAKKKNLNNSEKKKMIEELENKLEDLKLKILTNEIYLSTERKIFDQLTQAKNQKLKKEEKVK